jgi:monoterpene epsilon-lactone hydrolase
MSVDNPSPGAEFRGRLYGFFLGLSGIKKHFRKKLYSGAYPGQPDLPPRSLLKKYHLQESLQAGRKIWKFSPPDNPTGQVVLYLHGGAYVANIQSIHWDLIGELIQRANLTVVVPDYPLAPTANCLETYDFISELFNQLIADISPEEVTFMGDSAGAGLALGFAQQLRDRGDPLPGQLILLSPWLDVTMTNPAISDFEDTDKMLDVNALLTAGKAYAGNLDPRDYRVSPLYGDFEDLPRISLFIGTNELLLPDARKLKAIMEEQGVPLNYYEYPHMFHAWVTITRIIEARLAIEKIIVLLQGAGPLGRDPVSD